MQKPIPDFPRYSATTSGVILSVAGAPMKPRLCVKGKYMRVNPEQTPRHVHRLVLETFVGPRPAGMECRHLNGNRHDNRLANLAWGTYEENRADMRRHQEATCLTS